MKINNILMIGALLVPLSLAACGEKEEKAEAPIVRPVKTVLIEQPVRGGVRTFPARIDANRRVDLSFRVPGKIKKILVREGDHVDMGEPLAMLDQTDFQIILNEKSALFERARKDYVRGQELIKSGHISKMTFDRMESDYRTARSALNQAKKEMDYTVLTAPFSGSVSKRMAENFEEVQAKQPVFALRDVSQLEVKFDVPENIVLQVKSKAGRGHAPEAEDLRVKASFDAVPGKTFDLDFKEVSTRADPSTQTFEVTYTMPAPSELTVLPGMTANVKIDLSEILGSHDYFVLPVEAVIADNDLNGTIWVVNKETMTVAPRPVKVGQLLGNKVQIREGLEPGDRVVVAGVPFLTENMKVSLMADKEEPETPDGLKTKQQS